MSLSPTRSGGAPARIAVANWLVSSLGDVMWSTIFRFLWLALNSGVNFRAAAYQASPIPNVTVPVAFLPNVDAATLVLVAADATGAPVMVSTIAGPRADTTNFTYLRFMANHPPFFERDEVTAGLAHTRWKTFS